MGRTKTDGKKIDKRKSHGLTNSSFFFCCLLLSSMCVYLCAFRTGEKAQWQINMCFFYRFVYLRRAGSSRTSSAHLSLSLLGMFSPDGNFRFSSFSSCVQRERWSRVKQDSPSFVSIFLGPRHPFFFRARDDWRVTSRYILVLYPLDPGECRSCAE